MKKYAIFACFMLLVAASAPAQPSATPLPSEPWSCWVEIDGSRVHYIDTAPASGLPAIIIIPGYLGSGVTFQGLVSLLQPDMRVIIPDLPGFGLSEVTARECSLDGFVGLVESLREHLGLAAFTLAGSSMAALIVTRYASVHPEHVLHLVLLSPFGSDGQAGVAARIHRFEAILPFLVGFVSRGLILGQLRLHVRSPSVLSPAIVDSYVQPFKTKAGRQNVVQVTTRIVGRCCLDGCLDSLSLPVLVVVGSEDRLMDQATLGRFEGHIARCSLHVLGGARHLIQLDAPGEIARLVKKFLDQDGS